MYGSLAWRPRPPYSFLDLFYFLFAHWIIPYTALLPFTPCIVSCFLFPFLKGGHAPVPSLSQAPPSLQCSVSRTRYLPRAQSLLPHGRGGGEEGSLRAKTWHTIRDTYSNKTDVSFFFPPSLPLSSLPPGPSPQRRSMASWEGPFRSPRFNCPIPVRQSSWTGPPPTLHFLAVCGSPSSAPFSRLCSISKPGSSRTKGSRGG